MIHDLPEAERPRERCLKHGPETLSLRECLAILMGSGPRNLGCLGLAESLLQHHHLFAASKNSPEEEAFHLYQRWLKLGPVFFDISPSLGPAQKARLLASFELVRRITLAEVRHETLVPKELELSRLESEACLQIPAAERAAVNEWFGFFSVYKTGKVSPLRIVQRGDGASVSVSLQKLFREMLVAGAPGYILAHNHPSGDIQPSLHDIALTQEIAAIADSLGLQVVSHLVVTRQTCTPCQF